MVTKKMTMAQALLKFLDNQYISFDGEEIKFVQGVLGIFGHGMVVGLGEALESGDHGLKFIQGKNEQGMAHIAMGFAKQKNRRQIMAVTSSIGPGALNMVTAAGTATANRIPVLFLPSDAYASRQPDPVLQQIEQTYDYNVTANDAFKAVSKYWDRIARPEQLMTAAINAMRVLTDPADTGAVTLCLPQDVQGEAFDYPVEFFEKRVHYIQRRDIDPVILEKAAALIASKKKPFIICGGGVKYSDAAKELAAFTETFKIPFGETQAGKGAVLFEHPMNMGGAGLTGASAANQLAQEADLIIGIGTKLNDFCTCSKWLYQNDDVSMLTINLNSFDAYKMNSLPVIADVKLALEGLSKVLKEKGYQSAYTNEITEARQEWDQEVDRLYAIENENGLAQSRILGELNEKLIENNGIIVAASGSLPSDVQRVWRCRDEGVYHVEYGFSCMGYEVAAAVGVKLAEPDREVYVLLGDGSFNMLHSEFLTSLQEQIKINVILLDNHGFQCIHNLQRSQGIPSFGNEYRKREKETNRLTGDYLAVDYAMVARGYGGNGYSAKTVEEITEAFAKLKKSEVSSIVDIKTLPGTMTDGYNAWWRVGTAQVSAHPSVESAARDIQEHVAKARMY
ncbi:3D-(3,5/4)-trihydroxycyclohexane-1,2-dione acylhydrolase (decyclizing) [Anoxybacterium hadale]|uniref:3D-(3,5/4)-trihydroxycyclohexane-1,2-dione acylhydrolase (Decyclizing) n=1 Tax=Anoxybacterium hadale TaxID=3408580 RepID=A0ACD1AG14_9FIRM|nr:3D-(3,5/4)-trihydroxycyclohexane-1,2-dione acylhydrolase (decyclizing) [Clostridiales bacterium]